MNRECPVPMCKGRVAPRQLMCRDCWQTVPATLKSKVGARWRAWSSDLGNIDKARTYREAADDAIAAATRR